MALEIRINLLNREKSNGSWHSFPLDLINEKYNFCIDFASLKEDDLFLKFLKELNQSRLEIIPNLDGAFYLKNIDFDEDIFIFSGKGRRKYKVSKNKKYALEQNQRFSLGKNTMCFINISNKEYEIKNGNVNDNTQIDDGDLDNDSFNENSIYINTPSNSKKKNNLLENNNNSENNECHKSSQNILEEVIKEKMKHSIKEKSIEENSLKRKSSSTDSILDNTLNTSESEKPVSKIKESINDNDKKGTSTKSSDYFFLTKSTSNHLKDILSPQNIMKKPLYKIALSGFKLNAKEITDLNTLGIILNSDDENFEFLIIESFKRTKKVLISICKGLHILKKEWLYSCLIKNKILDFEDFYFKNKSIETEFNFTLKDSINIARKTKEKGFLCGKNFWIPKENKLFNEFRDIIINAGGALKETQDPDKECIILLGTDQVDLIKSLKSKNLKIFSNELLLVGCLRQKLDFKEFCL